MTAMDFFALNFYLTERKNEWFYRGTDDTVFNFRRLPSYLSELESRFDPSVDRVVRGDCVVFNHSPVYLQGGSGYLFSRTAAQMIYRKFDVFMGMWAKAEDATFGPFLDAIGIGVRNCCDPAFMGHGPAKMATSVLERGLTVCPPRNLSRLPIPWFLGRLRDVLVYHKKDHPKKSINIPIKRARLVFHADERIRWYTEDNFWPKSCFDDSVWVGNAPEPIQHWRPLMPERMGPARTFPIRMGQLGRFPPRHNVSRGGAGSHPARPFNGETGKT
jgi:hypothetical protein